METPKIETYNLRKLKQLLGANRSANWKCIWPTKLIFQQNHTQITESPSHLITRETPVGQSCVAVCSFLGWPPLCSRASLCAISVRQWLMSGVVDTDEHVCLCGAWEQCDIAKMWRTLDAMHTRAWKLRTVRMVSWSHDRQHSEWRP